MSYRVVVSWTANFDLFKRKYFANSAAKTSLYFFDSRKDFAAWNLCTAGWDTVHTGIAVKAPPIASVQNVLRILGSGLKLKEWGRKNDISSLREKCPYSELFMSLFSRIRTEYGEIRSISPYSVQMRENTDQNNSEHRHF